MEATEQLNENPDAQIAKHIQAAKRTQATTDRHTQPTTTDRHTQPAKHATNPVLEFLTKQRGAKAYANGGSPQPGRFVRWWRAHRPSTRALGWIAPLIVTFIGGFLRFFRLDQPHVLVFDEHYYVKDAWAMLQTGTERAWPDPDAGSILNLGAGAAKIDNEFANGNVNIFLSQPEEIFTHPPLGKWLIAIGTKVFGGAYPFAWRFTAALAGTLAILLIARVALRLFHNVTIATTAAIFMAFDGQAITLSRTAMLDGFLMVFVLGAFLCLLHHREWALATLRMAHEHDVARPGMVIRSIALTPRERRGEGGDRLKANAVAGQPSVRLVVASSGPIVAFSGWRLAAFILLALATGIKWSGGYFLAVFAIISVLWDGYNRRIVGYRGWFGAMVAKDGLLTALYALPLCIATYLASWMSWFLTPDAFYRHWAEENPGSGVAWLPSSLRSLVQLHIHDVQVASAISAPTPSSSTALAWPLQLTDTLFIGKYHVQPLSFDFPTLCGPSADSSDCLTTVANVGNPVVWWVGVACLVAALVMAIIRRGDWRVLAVWSGMLAGWAPWLLYMNRTTYSFYSIAFLPWVILATCYWLDWLARRGRYVNSLRNAAVVLDVATIAIGIYLLPLWTFVPMTTTAWLFRVILPGWARGM